MLALVTVTLVFGTVAICDEHFFIRGQGVRANPNRTCFAICARKGEECLGLDFSCRYYGPGDAEPDFVHVNTSIGEGKAAEAGVDFGMCDEPFTLTIQARETTTEVATTELSTLAPDCPGWSVIGGDCYKLINLSTYWDVELNCANSGGLLTSIQSEAENALIGEWLILKGLTRTMWIGGLMMSLSRDEFDVHWLDEKALEYRNWDTDPKEQRNYCTARQADGKFIQSQCDESYFGVCKRKLETLPVAPQCEEGWIPWGFTQKCYKVLGGVQNWEDSMAACREEDAIIATLESSHEKEYLIKLAIKDESYLGIWLGGRAVITGGKYAWHNDEPFTQGFWQKLEERPYGECLALCALGYSSQCGNGAHRMSGVDCRAENYATVCKKNPVGDVSIWGLPTSQGDMTEENECEDGWISAPQFSRCYKILDKMTFYAAMLACRDENSYLISLPADDDGQEYFLKDYFPEPGVVSMWIGGLSYASNDRTRTRYHWVDGHEGDNGAPFNKGYYCLSLSPTGSTIYEAQCDDINYPICKREMITGSRKENKPPPALVMPVCEDGWTPSEYTQMCYRSTATRGTYAAAEQICRGWGSMVATVTSYEENEVIIDVAGALANQGAGIWLGAKRDPITLEYTWADATELNVAYWRASSPLPIAVGDCLLVFPTLEQGSPDSHRWEEIGCNATLVAVCKKKT